MQNTTSYLDRRNYLTLALLVAVALLAASFGRWVIPSTGSDSKPAAVTEAITSVPSQLRANFSDLKIEQLESADSTAGLTGSTVAVAAAATVPGRAESFADLKADQLESADRTAGVVGPAGDLSRVQAQRDYFAGLKMAELDSNDRTAGLGPSGDVSSQQAQAEAPGLTAY